MRHWVRVGGGGGVDNDASGDGFHDVIELWEEEFALEYHFEKGKGDRLFFICIHVDFNVVEEDSDVALEWKKGSKVIKIRRRNGK